MKRILFLCFSLLTVVGVGVYVFSYTDNTQKKFTPEYYSAREDRTYLVEKIQDIGAQEAYAQFVSENKNIPLGMQHLRAHIVGEALFETEGTNSIAVCDSSFGFGCFHGAFTVGFATEGSHFIQEANEMCIERYGKWGTGCQHGIGHGIVEYVGRSNLVEALELCKETSQPTPLLGCTSGVFMEFNTPLTILPDVESLEPYPFQEETPYAACEDIPDVYKDSCYYELGGWWEVVLKGNKEKMGELCNRISDTHLKGMCALGVGNIVGPTAQYSISQSSEICGRMPHDIITLCHAGAAWSMFSNPEFSDRASQMCDTLLTRVDKDQCERTYDLTQI